MDRLKEKLIVIKLKHLYENDPVDRLRGLDIYKELKRKGYNVELFNMQKKIDVLINLDDTYRVKDYFDRIGVQVKKVIFDIQDDHFTYNKTSLKEINNNIKKEKLFKRLNKLNKKNLEKKFFRKIIRMLEKYLFKYYVKNADYVVTSSYSLEKITKKYNKNCRCIVDSIDFSLYEKFYFLKKDNNLTERVTIVWIGTEGNIPYLYLINNVLKKLQEKFKVNIRIISSDNIFFNSYSKQFLEKFDFTFEFIEWRKSSFAKYLIQSDIGIAPLPNEIAKSSNKILSYMAAGLPVVCSNVLDYSKFNKYVNIADNEKDWEEKLIKLILNPYERERQGKKNLEIAKNFSLERIVNEYERLFKELLND